MEIEAMGAGISSVVMEASLFRPVIPGSNTELDSVNPSLQSEESQAQSKPGC